MKWFKSLLKIFRPKDPYPFSYKMKNPGGIIGYRFFTIKDEFVTLYTSPEFYEIINSTDLIFSFSFDDKDVVSSFPSKLYAEFEVTYTDDIPGEKPYYYLNGTGTLTVHAKTHEDLVQFRLMV